MDLHRGLPWTIFRLMIKLNISMIVLLRKGHFCRFGEYSQRNLIKLYKGNLKKISQFFEGNFDQNKKEKRIFWFLKVEALTF